MKWNSIIGQDRLQRMLQRCILDDRIPQALLLTGFEGAGTVALALAFARTVNCEQPVRTSDTIAPCEQCHACKQSISLQHPNISIVTALPPKKKGETQDVPKDEVIAELQGAIHSLALDPYTSLRLANATTIRIAQIRELKRTLSLSAAQSGRRVVIILNADEMNVEAANSFLKTLEEPNNNVTIILTTERQEALLQTIVSRCQELVVPPLDDADIVHALVDRGHCDEDEALIIAPFAQGNLHKAIDYLSDDIRALRETAVDLLRTALKGKDYRNALADAVQEASESRSKSQADAILSLLALWLRDAYVIALAGDGAPIVNIDHRPALERFAAAFGGADFPAVLQAIELAHRDLARNVSISLVLLTTMLDIRRVFAATRHKDRATA
ncbi:MAG: hypothetical protein H7X70_02020 [Candidatus Kapabacteria bacterium]|nr:hypothetical protein [Candidatus Kapabacteria bacterium]